MARLGDQTGAQHWASGSGRLRVALGATGPTTRLRSMDLSDVKSVADIELTAHIGIGTLNDRKEAKRLCDDLNRSGMEIAGRLEAITLGKLEGGQAALNVRRKREDSFGVPTGELKSETLWSPHHPCL